MWNNYELVLTATLRPFNEYEGCPQLSIKLPASVPLRMVEKLPVVRESSREVTLERIHELEDWLAAHPNRIALEAEHHFAPGVYARPLRIPAGTCATGKMHVIEHLSILAEGSVRVSTDKGWVDITAPAIIHAMPGTKRAVVALTDATWITVHPNPDNELDPDKIEERVTTPDRGVLQ